MTYTVVGESRAHADERAQVGDVRRCREWFGSDACDGFVIAATHVPGAYEDVVRSVVPQLQRRGVFRDRYTGATLRDHLGLARPEAAARG